MLASEFNDTNNLTNGSIFRKYWTCQKIIDILSSILQFLLTLLVFKCLTLKRLSDKCLVGVISTPQEMNLIVFMLKFPNKKLPQSICGNSKFISSVFFRKLIFGGNVLRRKQIWSFGQKKMEGEKKSSIFKQCPIKLKNLVVQVLCLI